MSLTVSVAETAIPGAIAPSSISAQSIASDGDVGFGGFMIDDPGASIVTTGHKSVTVEESSCSQPRLFTGYLTDRDSGRSAERGMLIDDDRLHEATMVDLNACLSFRHLRGTESERPSETMGARLTWLLGTDQVSQFITGTAFATLYSNTMDAANYRGAYPKAVLDDLAGRRANLTYFVFWDPTGTAVSLYFGDDSTGIAESTLYVSNDPVDVNGTTVFPPDTTATLKRSPEEVYSEVTVRYAHGTKMLYRRRASTATSYVDRGTVIDKPYTGSLSTAQGQAEAFLDKHAVETDRISVTIIVPPESAGLVTAGQRMNVKFTHLDDYTAWTSMRVVSVNVRPINDVANRYALDLELELPHEGVGPSLTCDGSSNALAGISATAGPNTYVPDLFGAAVPEDEVQDPEKATDGNVGDPPAAANGAWFVSGSILEPPEIVREFMITLPETKALEKVTIAALVDNAGAFQVADQPYIYLRVGGTTYGAEDYASVDDPDVWGWSTATADVVATFNLGGLIETDSIVFGHIHPGDQTVGYFRLIEIAACVSDPDEEQEQTPVSTPAGNPVQSASNPTSTDDVADGYAVGQVWINTSTGDTFILTDNTAGAAVWQSLGGVSDHGGLTGLTDDDHTQYVLKTLGGKEVVNTVAASGATETLNLADGNVHDVTLTADCTFTFSGATNGVACSFTLVLRQDGTGGWTATWPGSVNWPGGSAPTLDETASTSSVLTFFTLDGGTNWYGFATGGGGGAAGTPALTLGTSNAAGTASTFVTTDATVAVFDATVPTTLAFGGSAATGSAAFAARRDHSHGMPAGGGELLISDTPSTPLVFADILQNEAQDDLLYSD